LSARVRRVGDALERVRIVVFVHVQGAVGRERLRLIRSILPVHGLMPLLMKPRNGKRWTREARSQIVACLRGVFALTPYSLVFLLPGSYFLLPFLAWWLDRRRMHRAMRKSGTVTRAKN